MYSVKLYNELPDNMNLLNLFAFKKSSKCMLSTNFLYKVIKHFQVVII